MAFEVAKLWTRLLESVLRCSSRSQPSSKERLLGWHKSAAMIAGGWQGSRGPRARTTLPGHCSWRSASPYGCAKGNRRRAQAGRGVPRWGLWSRAASSWQPLAASARMSSLPRPGLGSRGQSPGARGGLLGGEPRARERDEIERRVPKRLQLSPRRFGGAVAVQPAWMLLAGGLCAAAPAVLGWG